MKKQAGSVHYLHHKKSGRRKAVDRLSQEQCGALLSAIHWVPDKGWKSWRVLPPWESGMSSSLVWWRKSTSGFEEWSPIMLGRCMCSQIWCPSNHLHYSWWSSHHSDAEASCSQELCWVCSIYFYPLHSHKASNGCPSQSDLGPLHHWFAEGQCTCKARARHAQTCSGWCYHATILAELP